MYNRYHSKGLEVVGVNVRYPSDSADAILAFFNKYGAPFIGPLNKTPSDIARIYGVDATPTNYVIDREGSILAKVRGGGSVNLRRIESAIQRGLGES